MALFNRKNKEDKKKGGENIVGKIIYIFLLFAPLFSILTTSLYTIFNKNAFESYSGTSNGEYILTPIHDRNDFKENELYYFTSVNYTNIQNIDFASSDYKIYCTNVIFNYLEPNNIAFSQDLIKSFTQYKTVSANFYYTRFYDNEGNTLATINSDNNRFEFTFIYKNNNLPNNVRLQDNTFYQKTTVNENYYLDNSFDYGIYKTEQNNLFNWAKNTGTYTIMKTTTDGLEINNTFIPMLLTYWLIISVIYFIYDIALMLIWILHRKIHELTESV